MTRKLMNELRTMPKFIYILAAISAFGLSVGLYRMYAGLGETTNLSKAFPWGIWISFDLATVALSGGAFTLAALVYVFQFENLQARSGCWATVPYWSSCCSIWGAGIASTTCSFIPISVQRCSK